jgi:hypothetical protein
MFGCHIDNTCLTTCPSFSSDTPKEKTSLETDPLMSPHLTKIHAIKSNKIKQKIVM